MPNVVIATTMWGHVGQENGERREAELKNGFCSEMGADAYRVERFQDTYESAWHIICDLEKSTTATENAHQAEGLRPWVAQMKNYLSQMRR